MKNNNFTGATIATGQSLGMLQLAESLTQERPQVVTPTASQVTVDSSTRYRANPNAENGTGFRTAGVNNPMETFGRHLDTPARTGLEALELAGCAFTVQKEVLHNRGQALTAHRALVRQDTGAVLGVCSPNYGVIQPEQAFGLFDQAGGIEWTAAGSLRGGARLFAVGRVATFDVVPGDAVELNVLLWQSFDLSSALRYVITNRRLACLNVVKSYMLKDAGLSIRHTRHAQERLHEVEHVLYKANQAGIDTRALYSSLAEKRFSRPAMIKLCNELIPDPAKDPQTGEFKQSNARAVSARETLMEGFELGYGQTIPGVAGTAWAAFNAVTEFTNHWRQTRGGLEQRFESNLSGSGSKVVEQATRLLIAA